LDDKVVLQPTSHTKVMTNPINQQEAHHHHHEHHQVMLMDILNVAMMVAMRWVIELQMITH
jgi:hypothetical protein